MPADLLSHRLIFVTGKGGVGKTTVAQALGRLGVARGRRVIIAELAAAGTGGLEEIELAPGLFSIAINSDMAMEEYLRVKAGNVGGALSRSRIFATLAMATPGLREMLGMGKIWELAQAERRTPGAGTYDLVVVDAPATGHGVAALRTPRVFADTARVGPVAAQAASIAATLADRAFTAVVAVTLAEEMPVRETLGLAETLAADGLELDLVVLNGRHTQAFSEAERAHLAAAAAAAAAADDDAVRSVLAAAESIAARAAAQAPYVAELETAFGERLRSLPFRFAGASERGQLDDLSDELGRVLG